jgi:hypothetical protein
MLKLILTGVWVAVVTLGSVYVSIELSKAPDPAEEEAKMKAVQELVRGEMTTFPVIMNGHVEGYFLTKTSYIVDKTKLADVTLPIPALLTDELYTSLVGDKVIRVKENRDFDVAAFRQHVKEALNKRLEGEVVLDVIIEQVDYLSKEDIRNSQSQKQASIKSGAKIISEKVPEDVKEASSSSEGSGH